MMRVREGVPHFSRCSMKTHFWTLLTSQTDKICWEVEDLDEMKEFIHTLSAMRESMCSLNLILWLTCQHAPVMHNYAAKSQLWSTDGVQCYTKEMNWSSSAEIVENV